MRDGGCLPTTMIDPDYTSVCHHCQWVDLVSRWTENISFLCVLSKHVCIVATETVACRKHWKALQCGYGHVIQICDMIKRNQSDVANIYFEL